MKIEFDVKLETKDLYLFNMGQAYKGLQGIISIVIPAMIFVYAVYNWDNVSIGTSILNIGIGILLLVYVPISLYLRSSKIVKSDEVLSKPLHYAVSEEGIRVTQGEAGALLEWKDVYRMIAKGKRVLIYSNRIHAYIIPKHQIEKEYDALIELAKTKLEKYRIKA
ncbi:MAG: YcxB family protein [Agathobacter sp.]